MKTPNTAPQRTPGLGVQLPSAGGRLTGSVTGCAYVCPTPSPHAAVLTPPLPGPEPLSFCSLGGLYGRT